MYKSVKKIKKEMGYNGCRNCANQIEPLRICEWMEHGGDGQIHLICPRWKGEDDYEKEVAPATVIHKRPI